MNLLDHFHPPLEYLRHWHSFHHSWATVIAFSLNKYLPKGYVAEPSVQFGIEIDVAAFDQSPQITREPVATYGQQNWIPPAPTDSLPFHIITDVVEVRITDKRGYPTLVGAIELVSPANKDRAKHRRAFITKCTALLQQNVSLIVVDVVTNRRANLHDQLLEHLDFDGALWGVPLYAAAYRTMNHEGEPVLDIWKESLALYAPLPTLPLWLNAELSVPVDLHATYTETCLNQRIDASFAA